MSPTCGISFKRKLSRIHILGLCGQLYRASCSSDKSHVGQVSARFLQRLPRYSLSSFSYCRSSMALRTYDELIRIASLVSGKVLCEKTQALSQEQGSVNFGRERFESKNEETALGTRSAPQTHNGGCIPAASYLRN